MKIIIIFALATLINVLLSTIRSITTIKSNKWIAGLVNAISYGFYTWLVVLTVADFNLWIKVGITAIANFIGVWIIKFIEEKARKDKMWRIDLAIPTEERDFAHHRLADIPHNFVECGSWTMFNCYCATQTETAKVKQLGLALGGKYSAYESKQM